MGWKPVRDKDGQSKLKQEAFAAKTVRLNGEEKSLYKRIHGKSFAVVNGTTNLDFSVPYNNAKVESIEIINGELGDKLNFKVLDTPTGTISGIPNLMLNQFGFDVYMDGSGYYEQRSQYDADVILDMQFRIEFTTTTAKTVYINYILNEVK